MPSFPHRLFGTRRAGLAALAAACFGLAAGPSVAQVVEPGSIVQTIQTSLWNPPSPDPSGITYRPDTGELLTCDSEVDEMTIFAGVNVWAHTLTGVVNSTAQATGLRYRTGARRAARATRLAPPQAAREALSLR